MAVLKAKLRKTEEVSQEGIFLYEAPEDRRSVLYAIVCTFLLHFLLYFIFPKQMRVESSEDWFQQKKELEVTLVEPELKDLEQKYVEANQSVVQNEPNKVDNISNRNQQSAQEEKVDDISADNSPKVDGEEENSERYVSNPSVPMEGVPAQAQVEDSAEQKKAVATPRPVILVPTQLAPDLPLDELDQDESGEGHLSMLKPNDSKVEEKLKANIQIYDKELNPEEKPSDQKPIEAQVLIPLVVVEESSQKNQKARPRLIKTGTNGPLKKSPKGSTNTGTIAVDANFSEFGDYLHRMFESIELRWNELNQYGETNVAEMNSRVIIKFYVDREGYVVDEVVENINASRASEYRCLDAIKSPAPYTKWTEDMVRILGDRQPVQVTFIYR